MVFHWDYAFVVFRFVFLFAHDLQPIYIVGGYYTFVDFSFCVVYVGTKLNQVDNDSREHKDRFGCYIIIVS